MLLSGRTALVTGAARGIGREVALVLAEDGANVAVADRLAEVEETARAIAALGRRSAAVVFDVASAEEVQTGVAKVRDELGDVDVLVNNAGIVNNIAPLSRMTEAAWQREIDVNLSGAFHLIQATIGAMVVKGWGRIVNVSSIAALGGLHNQAAYAASKAGLIGLTHTVTLEFARHGITCNAILPGLIGTENVRNMPQEIRETVLASVPARRLGEPREIGYLISFLASNRAAFVNGAAIPIGGGASLNTLTVGSRKELAAVSRRPS
jgi:NAD(P)-dependent dehydrogenase (short-subunit alcohol dehydrogenase family)